MAYAQLMCKRRCLNVLWPQGFQPAPTKSAPECFSSLEENIRLLYLCGTAIRNAEILDNRYSTGVWSNVAGAR
jgi:hypothetical protein